MALNIEFLHVTAGDKKKKLDTDTPEGRQAAGELIKSMLEKGTALFLERGKKTYRIKGYDAATDSLIVTAAAKRGEAVEVKARGSKSRVAAVPPIAGGCQ